MFFFVYFCIFLVFVWVQLELKCLEMLFTSSVMDPCYFICQVTGGCTVFTLSVWMYMCLCALSPVFTRRIYALSERLLVTYVDVVAAWYRDTCVHDCVSVCLSHSKTKTVWAINTEVGCYTVHGRHLACIEPEVKRPKNNMENRGMRVNMNKKAMQSQTLLCDATTKVNKQPWATPPPKITWLSGLNLTQFNRTLWT